MVMRYWNQKLENPLIRLGWIISLDSYMKLIKAEHRWFMMYRNYSDGSLMYQ